MKIVQSFGSCNRGNMLLSNSGWYAPEYHLMSWALSSLQLTKYYDDVTLHADSVTSKILIEVLQLPYTNLICDLDALKSYHPKLWALPKIHTYAQQKTPFLHVDGDVIIWQPFDTRLLNGELIAQNVERATSYYVNMMLGLKARLSYFPPEIKEQAFQDNEVCSYNAGIFGGNDVAFFNSYASKAIEFIDKNVNVFSNIDVDAFNILFEQYLFFALVQQQNKKVNVLFNEVICDNEYVGFGDFAEVPFNNQYLHLIGTYKRNKRVCEQLANRLRLDYPEYYYRIIALFKNQNVPLKKDYYHLTANVDEQTLITRRNNLIKSYQSNPCNICKPNNAAGKSANPNQVKNLVSSIRTLSNQENVEELEKRIIDFQAFQNKIRSIQKSNFSTISNDYLYTRDLIHTQYFQLLFENKDTGYTELIVADNLVKVIESNFDWSMITLDDEGQKLLMQQINIPSSNVYSAIIPECDQIGYSIANIDELDLMLLEIMKEPITVNELLEQIKEAFDADDISNAGTEFEQLISGRIKLAIENKLIKVLI